MGRFNYNQNQRPNTRKLRMLRAMKSMSPEQRKEYLATAEKMGADLTEIKEAIRKVETGWSEDSAKDAKPLTILAILAALYLLWKNGKEDKGFTWEDLMPAKGKDAKASAVKCPE